jgi:hypothetical protein
MALMEISREIYWPLGAVAIIVTSQPLFKRAEPGKKPGPG